jgi:hypothetical protein
LGYSLTVQTDNDCDQVFIHGSPEGLRFLAKRLEAIAASAEKHGQSHDHLMTEEWGGNELSSELQGGGESFKLINQLIVYGWAAP